MQKKLALAALKVNSFRTREAEQVHGGQVFVKCPSDCCNYANSDSTC